MRPLDFLKPDKVVPFEVCNTLELIESLLEAHKELSESNIVVDNTSGRCYAVHYVEELIEY